MERHSLDILLLDLLDVLAVVFAEDDLGDAGPLGCQDLLPDASHGEHLAAQGNLTGHGNACLHLALRQGRSQRRGHGDAGRRTIFGNGPLGHVDVDVPVLKDFLVDVEQLSVGLDVLQGQHGRLLHHIAQVAGQRKLSSLAVAQAGLHEEYLTAHGRPGQASHHAGIVVALVLVAAELLHAQEVGQVVRGHLHLADFLLTRHAHSHLTHHLAQLLLQLAHTALAGIVLHDEFDGLLGDLQFIPGNAVGLHLLGNQVTAGYLHLLLGDVAAHLNQLHAVEQRRGDGGQVVGRGNKHHLREVVVPVEVVVVESHVLLGVEHLQERCARVAVVADAQFVNLVEHEDGVGRLHLRQPLDDASGHGADVGAPVSADLRLIMYTAQRHTHVFALEGPGDGASERGLAHTRRAVEAEDGRLHVVLQLEHGQLFQDAFLHLLHPIVVLVEHLLGIHQVVVVAGIGVPGQGEHRVEVGELHAVVSNLRIHPLQLLQLLVEVCGRLLAPVHTGGLLLQIDQYLVLLTAPQFVLDGLDLLLEEVFALLLVDVLARPVLYGALEFMEVNLAVEQLHQFQEAALYGGAAQQLVLKLPVEIDVGAGIVDGQLGFAEVADGKSQLLRHVDGHEVVGDGLAQGAEHHVTLYLVFDVGHLGIQLNLSQQVRARLDDILELGAFESLEEHRGGAVGQVDDTRHAGCHAVGVQVIKSRLFHLRGTLAESPDQQPFLLCLTHQPHRRIAPYDNRGNDLREEDHVAQRQDGNSVLRLVLVDGIVERNLQVGDYGKSLRPRIALAHAENVIVYTK